MPATRPLLSRKPARALPAIPLLPGAKDHLPLVKGRIHEACGPARHTLALWLAAQTDGPVFFQTAPSVLSQIAGDHLPASYHRRLAHMRPTEISVDQIKQSVIDKAVLEACALRPGLHRIDAALQPALRQRFTVRLDNQRARHWR